MAAGTARSARQLSAKVPRGFALLLPTSSRGVQVPGLHFEQGRINASSRDQRGAGLAQGRSVPASWSSGSAVSPCHALSWSHYS